MRLPGEGSGGDDDRTGASRSRRFAAPSLHDGAAAATRFESEQQICQWRKNGVVESDWNLGSRIEGYFPDLSGFPGRASLSLRLIRLWRNRQLARNHAQIIQRISETPHLRLAKSVLNKLLVK